MSEVPEDLLVHMLNIDAEIRERKTRLAAVGQDAKGLEPWIEEILADIATLTGRREEFFRRMQRRAIPCEDAYSCPGA
ncbi:hypothetical protein [Paraburkholderia tropica]|uniref:hypothetical protein n=1 Tax=Paraburkholderia tropica TaxID=92647 RepID=UPI002AB1A38A|nr:hypothetical protein [Paraburkholderia tropica]